MEPAKRRRAAAKGWLAREVSNLQDLVTRWDNVTSEQLVDGLNEFEKRRGKYEAAVDEVQQYLVDDELTTDIDTEHHFLLECRSVKATAESKLAERQRLKRDSSGNDGSLDDQESVNQQSRFQPHPANLPKLQIPRFSGDYTEWPSFFDAFRALIEETSIADITKFTYLRSLLSGEALSCIKGLSLTGENYHHAIQILKDRFERKEKIIFDHIQKLLSTDVNCKNVSNMWAFYNLVQSHIRGLENFGIDGQQYGVILTPLILSRLPSDIRMEWARASDTKESDLTFLMGFLKAEIERRERSQDFNLNPISDRNDKSWRREQRSKKSPGTASALVASETSRNRFHRVCAFCDRDHYSGRCPELRNLDFQEIRDKTRDHKLCYKCFRPSHIAKQCYYRCSVCNKGHNSIFCRQSLGRNNDSTISNNCNNSVGVKRSQGAKY